MNDNGALLTNSEVIEALKQRGADKQQVVSDASPSEHQVYQALTAQKGTFKTRSEESAFIEEAQVHNFSKQELILILNEQPKDFRSLEILIDKVGERFDEGTQAAIGSLLEKHFS